MNLVIDKTLKVLRRKVYPFFFTPYALPALNYKSDIAAIQLQITDLLCGDNPCMIARFGSVELMAVINYIGIKTNSHNPWRYITGEINEWWWNKNSIAQLQSNAGFFPLTEENVCRFAELMIADAREVDILGSWLKEEWYLREELANAQKVKLSHLEPPYLCEDSSIPSWTSALEGKKVLVVHPFVETIKGQYARREQLFKRKDILPAFELKTLKAVQSIGGNSHYESWFDALLWMQNEIDNTDYDICILGCGAYGFPLAAHVKRTGHKAIHLGGASQLLFGIKGRRWEERPRFQPLFNEYWVRPSQEETPPTAGKVEGGCYW